MASGRTLRKLIPFPKTTDPDKLCADQQSMMEALDNLNEGQQDFLQAGVVESTDWSFTATINSSTGALGSEAATGGKAWLPDPVISGALMRSVTSTATLSGLTPSTLPTTGKYMTIGIELTASTWGEKATVSVKSGTEKSTEAEAEAASPAVTSGKIRVRDVIVKNTSGVYSIVKQIDRRLWATGGEAKSETVAEGKIGKEAVTGVKLGAGTVRQETGTPRSFLSWGLIEAGSGGATIEGGTGDYTVSRTATGTYQFTWKTPKSSDWYAVTVTAIASAAYSTAATVNEVGFIVHLHNEKAEPYDGPFSFIVFGSS